MGRRRKHTNLLVETEPSWIISTKKCKNRRKRLTVRMRFGAICISAALALLPRKAAEKLSDSNLPNETFRLKVLFEKNVWNPGTGRSLSIWFIHLGLSLKLRESMAVTGWIAYKAVNWYSESGKEQVRLVVCTICPKTRSLNGRSNWNPNQEKYKDRGV